MIKIYIYKYKLFELIQQTIVIYFSSQRTLQITFNSLFTNLLLCNSTIIAFWMTYSQALKVFACKYLHMAILNSKTMFSRS